MPQRNDLTPNQFKAVEHDEGPLLVLAGPGAGKTRVITRRIARLIEKGVDPREILAITFTNKAADEMASRVAELAPGCRVWVSTFHRLCARLLRRRADAVGLRSNFSIFDTADQQQLLREVLRDFDLDSVAFPPSRIAHHISRAKNEVQSAEDVARSFDEAVGDHLQAVVARVYPEYQRRLLDSNAVDFDDLLLHVVTLLAENPELRRDLDARYRFILVDEYQDTNAAQYRIVAALSQDHPNLCVTGDPDQSIYGWRGARIDNILRFESEYPSADVVRLEQNFRSTPQILETADRLIAYNVRRKAKSLVTDNRGGEPVELLVFRDGRQEAESIAAQMRRWVDSGERQWSDFAVFYRVNALSREIELALLARGIPYQVAGGVEFFERAEIKDVLAYLKLVQNPDDRVAFARIVNTPRRGIGAKSLQRLSGWADAHRLSLLEAAGRAGEVPRMPKKAAAALKAFAAMIDGFRRGNADSVDELLGRILEETGYARGWEESESEEDLQRLANVQELRSAAREYDQASADEATLEGFLESVALAGPVDDLDESAGRVTLMTLHAAKGLEFPVVYVIGLEQNLIPHERSLRDEFGRELEEERRLLFVGITRSQQRLFLTQTRRRIHRGRETSTIPSDFLAEIEARTVDCSWDDYRPPTPETTERSTYGGEPGRRDETAATGLSVTTAAKLAGLGKRPTDATGPGFTAGMAVRHPTYGLGTVVGVSGNDRRQRVTVVFEDAQEAKTFVADKCPLQPVGVR